MALEILKIAAFSYQGVGGNPAGVVFADEMPPDAEMLAIAADLGFSETAFLVPEKDIWRIRYFAPAQEVEFCGHATIASGAALGGKFGGGTYRLRLNAAEITVDVHEPKPGGPFAVTLTSPPATAAPADPEVKVAALALFGLEEGDLDPHLPVYTAFAGALHLVIGLKSREKLAAMDYDFEAGKVFMSSQGFTTIALIRSESERRFHARNAFAIGGVFEDPATGAAAAAFGGYLREIGWFPGGEFEIYQGKDMGVPSRLLVSVPEAKDKGIRVSGATREMQEN
ncbi:MAG: PhzF family phenazine biosynthesis protein [Alphaproteobacteria bacterium]|nr:MAG: PhzF family phenazine biosynthesis protein [Alphaproteobacteria bacterium]